MSNAYISTSLSHIKVALRIDTGDEGQLCGNSNISVMRTGISTYDTPKERKYFSGSSIRCNFENRYTCEKQCDKN